MRPPLDLRESSPLPVPPLHHELSDSPASCWRSPGRATPPCLCNALEPPSFLRPPARDVLAAPFLLRGLVDSHGWELLLQLLRQSLAIAWANHPDHRQLLGPIWPSTTLSGWQALLSRLAGATPKSPVAGILGQSLSLPESNLPPWPAALPHSTSGWPWLHDLALPEPHYVELPPPQLSSRAPRDVLQHGQPFLESSWHLLLIEPTVPLRPPMWPHFVGEPPS
mmetsp:Transcript_144759/g.252417  ORF Transcript_144759/g.252417 Transcript_144759/m.252417 type:complete len:223 (-) Transcript_144759:1166-1834(-)